MAAFISAVRQQVVTVPEVPYSRPTVDPVNFTNPTFAHDGTDASDNSTYATATNLNTANVWSGFAAGSGTYLTLNLHVVYELVGNASNDTVHIEYSTNGGTGWTDVLADGIHNAITKTDSEISLSTSQDLTDIQVRVSGTKTGGPDGQETRIWELYVVGTYA